MVLYICVNHEFTIIHPSRALFIVASFILTPAIRRHAPSRDQSRACASLRSSLVFGSYYIMVHLGDRRFCGRVTRVFCASSSLKPKKKMPGVYNDRRLVRSFAFFFFLSDGEHGHAARDARRLCCRSRRDGSQHWGE